MTISTYAELKQAIQDYAKRTDALSMLDTFIDLAEVDIWDSLRTSDMDARTQDTTGTTDRFLDLPTGFIKMRRFRVIHGSGQQTDIEYVDPRNLHLYGNWYSIRYGFPTHFTIGGGDTDQIEFNCIPDQAYTVEMMYWKELTALSDSNTTNAVLTKNPMIYLSGCLKHFYIWAKNPTDAGLQEGIFEQQIARANRKARKGRYGPNPAITTPGMVV